MHFPRDWPSWSSVLSATNSTADAVILVAAIVAGISALHTLCLDFLIPGVGRMLGYLPPSSTSPPKAGSPEAILHAPPPSRPSPDATVQGVDDCIDEKLGTRQRRPHRAPGGESTAGNGSIRKPSVTTHPASGYDRMHQPSRPRLVQPQPTSHLANAARLSLERLASALDQGRRSSAVSAKLMHWLRDNPPFGPDFTPDNVNATWIRSAHGMDVDPVCVKIQAHIAMAGQAKAKCFDTLRDGFELLKHGSIPLTEFVDTAVQAMCLEEAWDLLGHFQYISMDQAQLFWIQKCVEDWRRSDEGLLCSSHVPLFGNPEALLYLLAAPGQSMDCRVMALHELAAMDQETWTRCVEELAVLELLEILAELPSATTLREMIVVLLIQLAAGTGYASSN